MAGGKVMVCLAKLYFLLFLVGIRKKYNEMWGFLMVFPSVWGRPSYLLRLAGPLHEQRQALSHCLWDFRALHQQCFLFCVI
jgi:hypothetical protein